MVYKEQYYRQLTYTVFQRLPTADEFSYFLEIMRNNFDKIIAILGSSMYGIIVTS